MNEEQGITDESAELSRTTEPSKSELNDLLCAIDSHVEKGGKVFIWFCPNKCNKGVSWEHTKTTHIATCNKCGETSSAL